jgi:hypothetical protein
MSGLEIQHFLVTYDPESDQTKVEDFGIDYNRALAAYAQAERTAGFETKLDVVLLSADSLETIKQTHSSSACRGSSPSTDVAFSAFAAQPITLQRNEFVLGMLGRAELEADDGAAAERVAQLLEGLWTGAVLAALDA